MAVDVEQKGVIPEAAKGCGAIGEQPAHAIRARGAATKMFDDRLQPRHRAGGQFGIGSAVAAGFGENDLAARIEHRHQVVVAEWAQPGAHALLGDVRQIVDLGCGQR
jgi:hypothetical protein